MQDELQRLKTIDEIITDLEQARDEYRAAWVRIDARFDEIRRLLLKEFHLNGYVVIK